MPNGSMHYPQEEILTLKSYSLIVVRGHEQGWLCLTVCCVDVAWSVVVIHWLTSNPLVDYGGGERELDVVRSAAASPRAPVDDSEARRVWREM